MEYNRVGQVAQDEDRCSFSERGWKCDSHW